MFVKVAVDYGEFYKIFEVYYRGGINVVEEVGNFKQDRFFYSKQQISAYERRMNMTGITLQSGSTVSIQFFKYFLL